MRKWYRKLKLDKNKKMLLSKEEKISLKNSIKKYKNM